MRKLWILLLVITIGANVLTGCSTKDPVLDSQPTAAQTKPTQQQTEPTETDPQEDVIGQEDTYWIASAWHDGDESPDLPTEDWRPDLIIRVDGTARFRSILQGIYLADDSCLHLMWERTADGDYVFYSALYPEPILQGSCENGILTLNYWGTTLKLQQAPMPQTAGQLYAPAELAGTWLLVSGEIEGWQWEAMPNELSSLVFDVVTTDDESLTLSAYMEERNPYGELWYSRYDQAVELLQEPLYYDCENEEWSVRIGPVSPVDENGYPLETEFYATLVGEDLLLVQRYYTLDGAPAVSHQTYQRFTDLVSWMQPEDMRLNVSNWVCTGYEDPSGEEIPLPSELAELSIILDSDQVCHFYYGDGNVQTGTWLLEKGGVLLLRGDETLDEPLWFGGVISGYWVDTEEGSMETYQMALYHNGNILKLQMTGYG